MNGFTIGTSALLTGQSGLDVVGQNIANAATPGYHRQAIKLASRVTGDTRGTGVDIATITRFTAAPVRTAILSGNSEQAALETRFAIRRQVETTLGTGEGGIADQLGSFFNQVEQLTARPDNPAARRPLIAAAGDLARQFNTAAGDVDRLRVDVGAQIPGEITEINEAAKRIADFNLKISFREQVGQPANDLRDQRDQIIDDLSKRIDITTNDQPFGVVNVIANGAVVVVGEFANTFQVGPNGTGGLAVTQSGSANPVNFTTGSLGAKLREYNTDIPATRARLDTLAGALVSSVNAVQATGIGLNGPVTSANGSTSVTSASAPLNTAGLPFPVQAGQLTVSVTNTATGTRTNTTIAIDPATQSLTDVATALNGVPGLVSSVDPTSRTLQLSAQSGFAFDFAGRDTNPPGGGAVANPDTVGFLAAAGVNGLFGGSDAASIVVKPEIVADPSRLAASRTGQPGDATNLERLAAVRDKPVVGGRTLAAEFADQASAVGSDVRALEDRTTAQSGLMQTLAGQEQSVVGVDTNEELVRLLDFQRMIQGASKYLSVVNSAMDEVMSIVR
jgi:flagellar hook-associated protein FlgK